MSSVPNCTLSFPSVTVLQNADISLLPDRQQLHNYLQSIYRHQNALTWTKEQVGPHKWEAVVYSTLAHMFHH